MSKVLSDEDGDTVWNDHTETNPQHSSVDDELKRTYDNIRSRIAELNGSGREI